MKTLLLRSMLGGLAAVCAAAVLNLSAAPPPGYHLVWADEFDGAMLDTNKWGYRQLGKRHDALNVREAVSVGGGQLAITTYTSNGTHHTGMIGTQGTFEHRFGYWEARLKFEDAPGEWSAFWIQTPTFGQPPGDPAVAGTEIDVVEHRVADRQGKRLAGQAQHTVHWTGPDQGVQSKAHLTEHLGLDRGFHTYGVEWTQREYRFYVDDKLTWTAPAPVSKRNQYIILSSEVEDDAWAGKIPAGGYGRRETSQTRLVADYVRCYERSVASSAKTTDRLVLAYHYPWYGYKPWTNWDEQENLGDHPLLGPYRSEDPELIDFQISLARDAGIDGFNVSWGGPGTKQDEIFSRMLEQAEKLAPGDFRLCLLCEGYAGKSDLNPEKVRQELGYVLEQHGQRRGYLRADGKPVVFIYTPQGWPVKRWRETFDAVVKEHGPALYIAVPDDWNVDLDYLSAFDGIAPYADKYTRDEQLFNAHAQVATRIRGADKPRLAALIGGGSRIQKLGFDIDRSQGKYLRQRLALAQKVGARWLTLTSWNEWFEAMQIEPSREYGFELIKFTREVVHQFKGLALNDSFATARLAVETIREPLAEGQGAILVTVSNPSPWAIYAVNCELGGESKERVAYVLHAGESRRVRLAWLSAAGDQTVRAVTVRGFLPNNEVVSVRRPL